jgi:TolB protein
MQNSPNEGGGIPSWLLWIVGPVTILAVALIIVAVVLGVQAGQRQAEMQRIQQVGIAHQRAVDLRAEGRFTEARREYERILILDPENAVALVGLQELTNLGEGGAFLDTSDQGDSGGARVDDATGGSAPADSASAVADPEAEQVMGQAVGAYQSGLWSQAVDHLTNLRTRVPGYQADRVEQMLFTAYVNLAAAEDQAGNLARALDYVDRALALRPDARELQTARSLVAQYVEALSLGNRELDRQVELLQSIYNENPAYRDVETRLVEALLAYGEELASAGEPCEAMRQFQISVAIEVTPGSIFRRDTLESECIEARRLANARIPTFTPLPGSVQPTRTPTPTLTPVAATAGSPAGTAPDPTNGATTNGAASNGVTADDNTEQTPADATPEPAPPVAVGSPSGGRLIYSAPDPVNGRNNIWVHHVGSGTAPTVLVENAQQPAMRPDGQRLAFRNLDEGSRGISTYDPATGLLLRFTTFAEDFFPSWNHEGNRVAFASNREGDRRWRVYQVWGDVNNQAQGIEYGTSAAYHPGMDRMAFRGCDETGNRCGIWTMTTAGGDRAPLTNVPADDRPRWAANGAFAVFQSEGRHGNMEIYRVDVGSGEVTRLTDHSALDVTPTVSPDGQWVAFFSNRSGAWAIWAVPSGGGEAQMVLELPGGLGNWTDHGLQWIN